MEVNLKGKNVNLRKLKKSDADNIFKNINHPLVAKYTHIPMPYKPENAVSFIKLALKKIDKKEAYELGIVLKNKDEVIGLVGLMKIDWKNKSTELGYWLGKKYWGQGIMTEATKIILDFGFKKLKLKRIYARVIAPNIASIKVLEKVGFLYEGKSRKANLINGKWLDDVRYSMLSQEYRK